MFNLIKIVVLSLISLQATADIKKFSHYEAHFITSNTQTLTDESAAFYGVVKDPTKSYISFSFLDLKSYEPVSAALTGSVKINSRQKSQLNLREIKDGENYYYVAVFDYNEGKNHRFDFYFRLTKYNKRYGRMHSFGFNKKVK